MKRYLFLLGILVIIVYSCATASPVNTVKDKITTSANDTIRIANDELEYEVIIIEPGFNSWLNATALPRNYHSQAFLETKNRFYVSEWNNRVLQPQRFNPNLYEMTINYDPNINYGYEVNYLIYNYMIFFQNTYKQKLFGFVPLR
ncbi:DUF6146 family protein [Flavobacterium sp. CHNK8]|uniref:DUF6146 family protein n=1 Tax=Flavobacterium sp. CHNK8 TaxID=2871165 RepID=UPI001C8DB5DC|nr:DUF6146 family protein [Flavobacterium sp. CHNK8]QZK89916.1 DUF6146 family protein [Flavobacterium sp. CHNK8]